MDTEDSRKRRREADAADAASDAALFGDDSMEDTQEEQPRVPVGRFMTAQEVLGYGINEEEEQEQDQEEDGSGDEELDLAVSEGDDDDDDDGGDGDEGDVILFDDDDIEWEDFDEDEEDIMEAAPNADDDVIALQQRLISSGRWKTIFRQPTANGVVEAHSTNNHFQCANSLCVPTADAVVYINSHDVMLLPTFPSEPRLLQTLSFKPICLTAKYGWVLAASENGELAYFSVADDINNVANEQPRRCTEAKVSNTMNNSVELIVDDDGSTLRVLMSCNDRCVRILTFPELKVHHVIRGYNMPINDSKMSPDGNYVASVGDRPKLCLVKVNHATRMQALQQGATMTFGSPQAIPLDVLTDRSPNSDQAENISSQYLSWSRDSKLVAATSDNCRFVNVVDVATRSVIHKIDAGGFTYAIAFSPVQENLLTFSMRSDYIQIFDVGTGQRQILSFHGTVGGMAFRPDGFELIAAMKKRIRQYNLVGVKPLLNLCVRYVQHNLASLQIDPALLPPEIQSLLFPLAPRASSSQ